MQASFSETMKAEVIVFRYQHERLVKHLVDVYLWLEL